VRRREKIADRSLTLAVLKEMLIPREIFGQ